MKFQRILAATLLAAITLTSCIKNTGFDSPDDPMGNGGGMGDMGGGIGGGTGSGSDDGNAPTFDAVIAAWDGTKADDAANDIIGTNEDLYWEQNSFTASSAVQVKVVYNGSTATVTTSSDKVKYDISGARVTIDMQTNSVKNVTITASGTSTDGQLKIYGEKKFKLTLDGLNLTSKTGPAINSQCKKRIFVHLADGTTNSLTDAATYSDDAFYLNASTAADEDRKGCFFSEGNLIFSGTGVLQLQGNYKHGLVTDGYLYTRPGVTIVVNSAAKNAIHVKGDATDNIGVYIAGGLIYTNTASDAGKGIKTDLNAEIAGGKLLLNTSGKAVYDSDENDTSSAAGLKTDGNVIITGGTLVLKSTGTGGKGINADGSISISGGTTTVTTTGGKYTYSRDLTSSPKGVKADGDITISGGTLNIAVTGKSDGSEGLESKATLSISGGTVYSWAYDDAINAATAIDISGGRVYAYGSNNDGIDSNGKLTISGGLVIGVGTSSPESGIDCDRSSDFKITGGTVISLGGTLQSSPGSGSQKYATFKNTNAVKGQKACVLDGSKKPVLTFEFPRTMNGATLFVSSPSLGTSYSLSTGGTLSGATDSWNGWYDGGIWTAK